MFNNISSISSNILEESTSFFAGNLIAAAGAYNFTEGEISSGFKASLLGYNIINLVGYSMSLSKEYRCLLASKYFMIGAFVSTTSSNISFLVGSFEQDNRRLTQSAIMPVIKSLGCFFFSAFRPSAMKITNDFSLGFCSILIVKSAAIDFFNKHYYKGAFKVLIGASGITFFLHNILKKLSNNTDEYDLF